MDWTGGESLCCLYADVISTGNQCWKGQQNTYGYTWKDFVAWIQALQKDTTWISYFRLQSYYRFSINLKGDYKVEKTTRAYKAKDRMCWSREDRTYHDIVEDLQQQSDTGKNKNGNESDNELENISMCHNSRMRSDLQTNLNILRKMDFAKQQLNQLKTLAQGMNQQGQQMLHLQDGQQCAGSILYNSDNIQCDKNMIQSIYDALKEKESRVELEHNTLQSTLSPSCISHDSLKRSLDDFIKSK
jgi:hypothetical protein